METNEHTNRKPRIIGDDETVGELDTFDSTWVKGKNLKPGMILLAKEDDGCGFGLAIIDHRMRSDRNSGCAKYFVANIETGHGRYSEINVSANGMIRVAAR